MMILALYGLGIALMFTVMCLISDYLLPGYEAWLDQKLAEDVEKSWRDE